MAAAAAAAAAPAAADKEAEAPIPMWLDCDPGHDDALAIILAAHSPGCKLLGVSTVAGNQTLPKTTKNACKVVAAAGRAGDVGVYHGADRPLLRQNRHDPEIHGESGLEGSKVFDRFPPPLDVLRKGKAVVAMAEAILKSDAPVALVATGMLTNVAILLRLYPEVLPKLREISLMGGAIGIGNRHPVAEFNILEDPEAAAIVFNAPVRVTMVPLEVTHTALATEQVLGEVERLGTPFASMVCDLIRFFKDTYRRVFKFEAPPIHDPCAVAAVLRPDIFELQHLHVDVVTGEHLCAGQTVVDVWEASSKPKNVYVARSMDTAAFWELMLGALKRCNGVSPVNQPRPEPAEKRPRRF
eukprot:TRINITY_DN67129_c0_g1_i1.p2 TRINITY_DN67129_c0_g1~~TRINITY_DN67129_c0_g1_i1.p2  ORF type:complete len:379 (+),score=126.93 TRINITY_DN67129_c0_g1_i1:75-1139(+)